MNTNQASIWTITEVDTDLPTDIMPWGSFFATKEAAVAAIAKQLLEVATEQWDELELASTYADPQEASGAFETWQDGQHMGLKCEWELETLHWVISELQPA